LGSTTKELELASSMSVAPRDIPTSECITTISQLEIKDEKGQAIRFGSLFEDQKTVIIFIRTCFHSRGSLLCSLWFLQVISFAVYVILPACNYSVI